MVSAMETQEAALRLDQGHALAWHAQAMGDPRRGRAQVPGLVIAAVSVSMLLVLPACSAGSPGAGSPAAGSPAARTSGAAPSHPARAGVVGFTVAGSRPVLPSGSQDTHAQASGAGCDSATFGADEATGVKVAGGFALAGFSASAALLEHFLAGKGTEVDYRAGSVISKQALASDAFRAVDSEVQELIASQLKAGRTRVRLTAAQLPTVAFESMSSDLYWGFRGTQGLTVTGSGSRENGRFTGTLSYVIRDSYGFPAGDTLAGFGPPMRYLQTVCGAPQHAGGAHWFPDTITVTVPFSRPA